MPNNYFSFKQFTINQRNSSFKVGTDGVLLGAAADLTGAKRILDVGTSTGLIAIMIAQRCNGHITAIEPDEKSFLDASGNVKSCRWIDRINLENKDFHTFTVETHDKFDLVLSNPPYFRDSLKNPDPDKSSARHTHSLSPEGILEGTVKILTVKGSLQLILPYAEGSLFIAEASQYGLFCNRIIKIKTVPEGDIKRLILKFERTRKPHTEKFLTIGTGVRHQFTVEYKELTKDFYLRF